MYYTLCITHCVLHIVYYNLCITHCVLQLVYYNLCITPWVKLRKEKRSWIPAPSPCLLCAHVECMSQSLSKLTLFQKKLLQSNHLLKKLRFFVCCNPLSSFPSLEPGPKIKANFDPTESRSKTVTFIIRGYCTLILDGWVEGGDPTNAFIALGPGSESSGLPKPVPTIATHRKPL